MRSKLVKAQLKLLDKYIEKLTSIYIDEYTMLLDEIAAKVVNLYNKISVEDKPLLSHLYQYSRYVKLTKEIQNRLTELGLKQEQQFKNYILDYYKKNAQIVDTYFEINDKRVQQIIVEDVLKDDLWSTSIWRDKRELLSKVRHELISHVVAGKTAEEMAESLKPETLTNNFYNRKRLVRTELVKYYGESTLDRYKNAGITKVQRHCIDDSRSCEECKKNNNRIYTIKEAEGVLPRHPNCRD